MTKKAAISGRISQGSAGIVFTALMAKVTTMPASMPDATEAGILAISRVSGRNRPVAISISAVRMKAPTASAMVKPLLAATSAAPGVDHAVITGILVRQDSHRRFDRHGQADAPSPSSPSAAASRRPRRPRR